MAQAVIFAKRNWVRTVKRISITVLIIAILCVGLAPACLADGEQPAKLVVLTFDDGPDWKYTGQLIDGLAMRPQAKVTFFFLGCYTERYPDVVLYAWNMGHQVGNHTYDHCALGKMYREQAIVEEIEKTEALICDITGQAPHLWVRPPYGSLNDVSTGCIRRPLIIWSSDPGDWRGYSASVIYQNICNDARDGIIIGLHCNLEPAVAATLDAIDHLAKEGYQFVTVEELLWLRGISVQDSKKYYSAYPTDGTSFVNTGWLDEDAGRCWFDQNGWRHYGWLRTDGKTYYMDSQTGFMLTGWQFIDGFWYDLGDDGALRSTVSWPSASEDIKI